MEVDGFFEHELIPLKIVSIIFVSELQLLGTNRDRVNSVAIIISLPLQCASIDTKGDHPGLC